MPQHIPFKASLFADEMFPYSAKSLYPPTNATCSSSVTCFQCSHSTGNSVHLRATSAERIGNDSQLKEVNTLVARHNSELGNKNGC